MLLICGFLSENGLVILLRGLLALDRLLHIHYRSRTRNNIEKKKKKPSGY